MTLIIWAVLLYLALRWCLPAAISLAWDRRKARIVPDAIATSRALATHDATGNVTEVAGVGMGEFLDGVRERGRG